MPGSEDKFRQVLIEEGLTGTALVESKMVRGSTHDKDRTTETRFVNVEDFNAELDRIRDALTRDMWLKRRFDPDEFDSLEELEEWCENNRLAEPPGGDD